jgi:5-methyltetrahydrofolate--homocysteine methyltransferase
VTSSKPRANQARFPLAHVSGGVSNVSFSFRGNNRCAKPSTSCSCTTPSRPAWTWASSTPAQLPIYDDLDADLRERVEDVVLNRRADATERLLEIAERYKGRQGRKRSKAEDGAGANCRSRSA